MHARFLPSLLLGLLACGDARQPDRHQPPAAEFILAAGDSAYWVTTDSTGVHVRAAPLELAQLNGRFVELYVVDDDQSYEMADLIGQGVYRRDLRTGDSVRVFTDSIVPALAREYARAHPHERRLAPDEEADQQPEVRATATLEFLGTHGPFVSYSLHTDVERTGSPLWHVSRRGVFDIRSGRPASVADVVGQGADSLLAQHERMAQMVTDSVRVHAPAILGRYHADPMSFTLTTANGSPAIAFAIPTSGNDEVDQALALPPVPFAQPSWWRDISTSLPVSANDGAQDRWQHHGYAVVARYDSTGTGRVIMLDAKSREWPVAAISAPASRIYWLDGQAFDSVARHALVRAFEEAAMYGGDAHVALRSTRTPLQLTTFRK